MLKAYFAFTSKRGKAVRHLIYTAIAWPILMVAFGALWRVTVWLFWFGFRIF